MKHISQVVIIILLIVGFVLSIILIDKAFERRTQILTDQIQLLSTSFETEIDNQTALLYRIVGEAIPVIVPETEQSRFEELQNSVIELKSNQDKNTLQKASNLYMDFIKSTAPWIQETLANDILSAKYDIDYYSLLISYSENQDINSLLDGLENFIISCNDYYDIQSVVDNYNKLVEQQENKLETEIKQLEQQISDLLSNKNMSSKEVLDLIQQCQLYNDDDTFSETLEILNIYLSETLLKEQITADLDNLKKQLSDIDPKSEFASYSLEVFTQNLAQFLYNTKSIENIDNTELKAELNTVMTKIMTLQAEVKKQEEYLLLKDIELSIEACEKQLKDLSSGSYSTSMITILATQVATLQYNIDTITLVDTTEVRRKLKNCKNHLSDKENAISSVNTTDEEKLFVLYNQNALQRISSVNKDNESIGTFDSDKKSKRMALLLKLEEINQNYLYLAVNTLYQQVYQEIWNSLDSDSRFEVTKSSITITKRGLNETF